MFYRAMQNICHLNVTTVHVFLNIRGQEIDIRNYIPVIEDIVVLTVKPHSPEGKQIIYKKKSHKMLMINQKFRRRNFQ